MNTKTWYKKKKVPIYFVDKKFVVGLYIGKLSYCHEKKRLETFSDYLNNYFLNTFALLLLFIDV